MLGEDLPFQTHDQALKAAASWGLPVSNKRKICKSTEEIENLGCKVIDCAVNRHGTNVREDLKLFFRYFKKHPDVI